jgi:hypothetical protein
MFKTRGALTIERVADPVSIWSVDPDPDPGGQKLPTKVEYFLKVHVLKCWIMDGLF